jgi:hypothetical protein
LKAPGAFRETRRMTVLYVRRAGEARLPGFGRAPARENRFAGPALALT